MTAWHGTHGEKQITASDGTRIAYEVLGRGDETLIFANGLGGHLLRVDARGRRVLGELSHHHLGLPRPLRLERAEHRKLAVAHHVEDLGAILDAEGIDRAVLCGWSMGVQISSTSRRASRSGSPGLVLMNGTHGHVLSTGFQPLFSVPFLPKRLHQVLDWMQDHGKRWPSSSRACRASRAGRPGCSSI